MLYKVPSAVLAAKCNEIEDITDYHVQLYKDMKLAMFMHKGVGLAANQLGHTVRMFIWDNKDTKGVILNPVLLPQAPEEWVGYEGCLSIPDKVFEIERSGEVFVMGLDLNGNEIELEASGFLARIFQHELDHLNGLTILNRAGLS